MTTTPDPTAQLTENWGRLCDSLRSFGEWTLQAEDPVERAEGLRHALRFLGHLADYELEHSDPLRPEFWRIITPKRKFYGDGVDVDYDTAAIDGHHTYRISGTRGTVPYLAFIVNRRGNRDRLGGNIVIDDDLVHPDGTFEVFLSPDLGDRVGITTDDRTAEVVARQYHHDRAGEVAATYTIELVGDDVPPRSPLDEASVAFRLSRIALGLDVSTQRLQRLIDQISAHPNEIAQLGGGGVNSFFGTSSNDYRTGWFSLEPHQALELVLPPQTTRYTGVQLFNRWFESLEFRDHQTMLNDRELERDADGRARIIIGGAPREGNWLDTCGHREGMVIVRYLLAEGEIGEITTRVIEQ